MSSQSFKLEDLVFGFKVQLQIVGKGDGGSVYSQMLSEATFKSEIKTPLMILHFKINRKSVSKYMF